MAAKRRLEGENLNFDFQSEAKPLEVNAFLMHFGLSVEQIRKGV